jgi:tRNA G10  N-methylase Trm11
MLVFCKGECRLLQDSITIHDFIDSSKPDKLKHHWAQSSVEAEYMTKMLTISEDAVVLDPFMGSGAFLIPAIKLGRYAIGVEIDKAVFDTAVANIKSQTGVAVKGVHAQQVLTDCHFRL